MNNVRTLRCLEHKQRYWAILHGQIREHFHFRMTVEIVDGMLWETGKKRKAITVNVFEGPEGEIDTSNQVATQLYMQNLHVGWFANSITGGGQVRVLLRKDQSFNATNFSMVLLQKGAIMVENIDEKEFLHEHALFRFNVWWM